ncbi:MAG: class II fructose-bisphosphate aldolase [Oscillospiraceae bacterium]|jgi:ketose-bisphosphate aldolase
MLTTTKEMLQKACKEGYAVPAINTQGGTYDMIRAICMAAEELNSPIILAHYLNTGTYAGHDWFYQTAKWMAEKVTVPVAIHLDHGDSFQHCMEMLQLGFTSIMYDGSSLPLEENASTTAEVVRVCHAFGVPVEAEMGQLARVDSQSNTQEEASVVNPEDVRRFLELCSPDFLALGIGNAHGFYNGPPQIRIDVLEQCRKFTDIPFVLHGCTGMSEQQIQDAIAQGVAKLNFGTQIRCAYLRYLKEGLEQGIDQGHSWRLSAYAEEKLRQDVKEIIQIAGSSGKA